MLDACQILRPASAHACSALTSVLSISTSQTYLFHARPLPRRVYSVESRSEPKRRKFAQSRRSSHARLLQTCAKDADSPINVLFPKDFLVVCK